MSKTTIPSGGLGGGLPNSLTVGSAVAEDTKVVFDGNAQDFHIGLDDSADSLSIGLGSALGTTTHMFIDATGAVTMPLNPCAMTQADNETNFTGDATNVTLGTTSGVGHTEKYDQNADLTGGIFTAPVDGKYMCAGVVALTGFASNHSDWRIDIEYSNRAQYLRIKPADIIGAGDGIFRSFCVVMECDANDTIRVKTSVTGGSKVVDLSDAGGISFTKVA